MADKSTQLTPQGDAPTHSSEPLIDGVAGDRPMTGAQRCRLQTLCEEARQPFDPTLTQAQARQRIEELHRLSGPDAELSAVGEEDPGAALGEPQVRAAMQAEAGQAGCERPRSEGRVEET
jgi:Protein of unknown function (DUF3072)